MEEECCRSMMRSCEDDKGGVDDWGVLVGVGGRVIGPPGSKGNKR